MFRPLGFNANGFSLGMRISLFKTFLRPILEYGLPLITNVAALVKLQSLQSLALRFMFSAPPRTSTTALHALAGLPLITTRQAILRARWLRRARAAPSSCLIQCAVQAHAVTKRVASTLHDKKSSKLSSAGEDDEFSRRLAAFVADAQHRLTHPTEEPPLVVKKDERYGGVVSAIDGYHDRRAAHRVALWILRRPFGRQEKCIKCGEHNATTAHMQRCMCLPVDALIEEGSWRHAASVIRVAAKRCTNWKCGWSVDWSDAAARQTSPRGDPP
jgi:hypothetical protein